jgi:exonuclease VII large subunit
MSDSNTYFNDRNPTVFTAEELVAIFRRSSEKIATLHAYSYADFTALSGHIRAYYRQAAAMVETISKWNAPEVSLGKSMVAQAQESLKNISSIVTKLQFHDIIRQQLEHIQQTNESIIEELIQVTRQHVRSHARETYKYLSIVPDIARLHVAQLAHTNKEYQNAFADIKASLEAIWVQTTAIAGSCIAHNQIASTTQDRHHPAQIILLADTLSSAISRSLEQIKNCESFDKLTSEITDSLTVLIPHAALPKDYSASEENKMITHLKNLYTMKSERMVHEQAFGKDPVVNISHTETDDNVELF